ncbi:MAG: hypothetical protein JWM98_368 [Thermoleophilia bacterium]|nr:hypothetical protein [Thermoleophilia bacterium]
MREVAWDAPVPLETGGELRTNGPADAQALVLLAGGGTGASAPGKWSTSMVWLAPRVRRGVGDDVRIAQVRYRDSSFGAIRGSMADVGAALEVEAARPHPAQRIVLVGLSMGGGTCLANAGAPGVVGLVAMAPWFPTQLPVSVLRGRRLLVVHGSLDNALPLVPGTSLRASRDAVRRAEAAGADAEWRCVQGGLHGLAVRREGRIWRLPRAGAFARQIVPEVARLTAGEPPVRSRSAAR